MTASSECGHTISPGFFRQITTAQLGPRPQGTYLPITHDQWVEIDTGTIVILDRRDDPGPQEFEEGVVAPVLLQVLGVPGDRVIYGEHHV